MCLQVSNKKKLRNFFATFKSLKKGVGSVVGSGSVSQRCGSVSGSAPKCHGSPTLVFNFFRGPVQVQFFIGSTFMFRLAISLGGDTDTIASMAGAITGAYLGIQVSAELGLLYLL